MADFNLEKFVDEIRDLAEIRNLDPYNPITIFIQNTSSSTELRIIAAMTEPSKYVVPTNGIWIMLDPRSPNYRKVFRLVDANNAADGFNLTWVEIFSKDAIFAQGQYFDNLRGQAGPPGPPGKDSITPGPPGPQGPAGNAAGIVIATGISLQASSRVFHLAKDQTVSPSRIYMRAVMENLSGATPVWTITNGNAVIGINGAQATLDPADMSSDTVTVRVSYTDQRGVPYYSEETFTKVRDGENSLMFLLTSETLALPSDIYGAVSSYLGAATTVQIFYGAADVTANWSLTKTDSSGVNTNLQGKTLTVTNLQVDAAYTDIVAKCVGFPDLHHRFNVSRVRTGKDGLGSYELLLDATTKVFSVNDKGVSTPASSTFTATLKNITGTPVFTIVDGKGVLKVTGNKAVVDYATMETDSLTVRATVVQANGAVYTKDETVVKLRAGVSTIFATLSSNGAILPCKNDGTVLSVLHAHTIMQVFVGNENQTDQWTYTKNDSTGLVTKIVGNAVNVVSMGVNYDDGACDITASRAGFPNVVKRFNVSKAKAGRDGSGANAQALVLSSTSEFFTIDRDGEVFPKQVAFAAKLQNIEGTVAWSLYSGDAGLQPQGTGCILKYEDMVSESITVRAQVTNNADSTIYEDFHTVTKIRESQEPLVALLTNESVTLPANSDGVITDLAGASVYMNIFRGTTDDSHVGWQYEKTDSVGVVSTITDNHVVVTAMTVDRGYVDIKATRTGFPALSKRLSLARVKAGKDGNSKQVGIWVSSQVFAVKKDGTVGPSDVVFHATKQNLTGTPQFFVTNGSAQIGPSGMLASLAFKDLYTDIVTVTARLVEGGETYEASVTVVVLEDGADATVAMLTNEAVVLPANSLGTVLDYSGGMSTMYMIQDAKHVTEDWVFSKEDGFGVTSRMVQNICTITKLEVDAGYVDITAKKDGYPDYVKRFNVSRVRSGADGKSTGIDVLSDTPVVVIKADGDPVLSRVQFSAVLNNISGVPTWTIPSGTATLETSPDGLSANFSTSSMTSDAVTVRAELSYQGIPYVMQRTITKLHAGSDAIVAQMATNSISLVAKADGVVTSYTGADTTMQIYQGSDNVTGEFVFTKTDSVGLTSELVGNKVKVMELVADRDSGYVVVTATRASTSTVLTQRLSITKAKAGVDGSPKQVTLQASSRIFAVDKLGVPSIQQITLAAYGHNMAGVPEISIVEGDATLTGVGSGMAFLRFSDMRSDALLVKAVLTDADGFSYEAREAIVKIYAGADSVTAMLTNETATVPATIDGAVTTFDGVATSVRVYQGPQDITSLYEVVKVENGPGVTSVLDQRGIAITGMTGNTGYVDITVRLVGAPTTDKGLLKRFNLTKVKAGSAGMNGLTMTLSSDSIVLPANVNGVVSSYANGVSAARVLNGTIDDSINWASSRVDGPGITSTISNDGVVTITNMDQGVDSGIVTVKATRAGYPTMTRVLNVAKVKAGLAGAKGADGTRGSAGQRGSMSFYISGQTSWSDAAALSAVTAQGGAVINDIIVQYNAPTSFNETRQWNGTAWVQLVQVLPGSMLVKGSVGANELATNAIRSGSTIIDNGAISTANLAANAVTQAVGASQTKSIPIPATGVWTEFLRYPNLDLAGLQQTLVWGTAISGGIHQKQQGEVAEPGQGEETYDDVTWLYNLRPTWFGIRVTFVNTSTSAEYHFVVQEGVMSSPAAAEPLAINALYPPVPAARYNVVISARVLAQNGSIDLEGVAIRAGQISILETKR